MEAQKIRITCAIVDTHNLTMYTTTGERIVIAQGDPRIATILEVAIPLLAEGGQGWADISLEDVPQQNHYSNVEDHTNGFVKFFRIAKSKLKEIFAPKVVEPMSVGKPPTPVEDTVKEMEDDILLDNQEVDQPEEVKEDGPIEVPVETRQTMAAVAEVMKHAVPAKGAGFVSDTVRPQGKIVESHGGTDKSTKDSDERDTIVAVVNNKVIPGMERIASQFQRASNMGSTKGVEAFLNRLTSGSPSVIEQRKHSVDDLLKFMERADLPIADDGTIIIYKVLRRRQSGYVDCHSGNVPQQIGSYVHMDPSLVDHNRRNECSHGLHVARRGYISNFSGDVCVLAKLAPEDVIAVPEYDANKMRVCGYHILFELTSEMYQLLKQNKPITQSDAGKVLLAKALSGQHVHILEHVKITGNKGSGIQITKKDKGEVAPKPNPVIQKAEALVNADEQQSAPAVDPKAIVKQVEKVAEEQKQSRKDVALKLYNTWDNAPESEEDAALKALLAYKKAAKVGWDKLGVPDPTQTKKAAPVPAKAVAKPVVKAKAKPKKKVHADKVAKSKAINPKPVAQFTAKHVKAGEPVVDLYTGKVIGETVGSPRERIEKLLAIGIESPGVAKSILDIKKKSKKNWLYFNINSVVADQIVKLAGPKEKE